MADLQDDTQALNTPGVANVRNPADGAFPRPESLPHYESLPSVETAPEKDTPQTIAPKPKSLEENVSEISPSGSFGRVLDQRSVQPVETITTIGNMDANTKYGGEAEDKFIKGVTTEHDAVKP